MSTDSKNTLVMLVNKPPLSVSFCFEITVEEIPF